MTNPKDNYNAYVGQTLREALERSGRTQRDLASELNITQGLLSRKLAGAIAWTVQDFVRTCRALKLHPQEVFMDIFKTYEDE